jgi:hypothetical protein
MAEKIDGIWGKVLMALFIASFLSALFMTFYRYYYTKDYDFLIEAQCNSEIEHCFIRDCSNPDDCPPNGLSSYKQYTVKAYDFPKCLDNTCFSECVQEIISCVPVPCDSSGGDECSDPKAL